MHRALPAGVGPPWCWAARRLLPVLRGWRPELAEAADAMGAVPQPAASGRLCPHCGCSPSGQRASQASHTGEGLLQSWAAPGGVWRPHVAPSPWTLTLTGSQGGGAGEQSGLHGSLKLCRSATLQLSAQPSGRPPRGFYRWVGKTCSNMVCVASKSRRTPPSIVPMRELKRVRVPGRGGKQQLVCTVEGIFGAVSER